MKIKTIYADGMMMHLSLSLYIYISNEMQSGIQPAVMGGERERARYTHIYIHKNHTYLYEQDMLLCEDNGKPTS
jgi:hypothetical protein